MSTKKDVLNSYRDFQSQKSPNHYKWFESRLSRNNQQSTAGCEAEAMIFCCLLKPSALNPEPLEDSTGGGPDFVCRPPARREFTVEVTVMNTQPEREERPS